MASPQREDGYTAVANELLEAIFKVHLSGNQLRLVLLVLRESYGWSRKESMPMGYKTMNRKTGISRSSIQLALSVLIDAKVLSVRKGRWSLNKDYQKWEIGGQPTGPGGASPLAPGGASPLAPGGQPTGYSKAIDESNRAKQTAVARKTAPRRSPVQEVVELYKFLKKIGYTEILGRFERIEQVHYAWDQANYKIYLRSAKKLLNTFGGDLAAAKVYLTARADEWDEKGLDSWELHGIARDAVNFKAKEETRDAQADNGRALPLRGVVGDSVSGALVAPGGRRPDGGEGSHRRFTPARELAGRALEGLQPQDD